MVINVVVLLCRPEQPFSEWTCAQVCDWLTELGLECEAEAKRWGKNGAQILAASTSEIEKELALKVTKATHFILKMFKGQYLNLKFKW